MTETEPPQPSGFLSRIDSSTVVPLSVVGLILMAIASFAARQIVASLDEQSTTMKAQSLLIGSQADELSKLSHRIDMMELRMADRMKAVDDAVLRSEMRAWVRELKAVNLNKIEVPLFDQ